MQIEEAIEYLKMRSEKYKANKELMGFAEDIYGAEAVKEYDKKQEAVETVLNGLEKKDKVINEIEDLCIMKSDEDGQEYGGIIIWNFANKIMDIIKKAQK